MAQSIFGGATDYSEQTCQDILSDVLRWVDLTRKERDTYTLLKQNLKKYEQYIGALLLYQRVQLKAIMTNFTLGKMVMNMSNVAKKILRK